MGANCLASTTIGVFFCFKGCSAEKIRNAFTFVPPQPSYSVQTDSDDDKDRGKLEYEIEGLRQSPLYRRAAESCEVHWVSTRRGTRIPLVWVNRTAKPHLVLLHCHGNATDIGMMMGMFHELSRVLGIEVVGVEYTGYGASTGKPSAGHTYADVEAAYDFVVSQGVAPDRIVAYGQSVGSGPVAWLASRRELGGIVLHSPLLSGIKVIDPVPSKCCRPSCVWCCFDFYPNDERVRSVRCPVLIMHGQQDEIIPFYHGYRLYRACPKASRWPAYFPERAGHNNLVETDSRMYFGELSAFLNSVCNQVEDIGMESPPLVRSRLGSAPPVLTNVAEVGSGASSVGPNPFAVEGNDDLLLGGIEASAGPADGLYEEARKGNVVLPGSVGRQHDSSDAILFQGSK